MGADTPGMGSKREAYGSKRGRLIPLGSRAMLALHGDSRSASRGDAAKTTSAAWARLPSQCGGGPSQARSQS